MRHSAHSEIRMQQRGIPPLIVDWLVSFGQQENYQGVKIHYFDKASRKKLRSYAGEAIISRLHEFMDAYVVMADDKIITVGKRYSRLNRN